MRSALPNLETIVNSKYFPDTDGILDNCMYELRDALDPKTRIKLLDKTFDIRTLTPKIATSLQASL